jgi:hypothetical protein
MREITRRGFLKKGIAGAGLVALSPSVISLPSEQESNIIYRTLGKTEIKVPVISFGVMRAYMHAYGYSMPSMARELLSELGTSADPFSKCDVCNIKCSRNFSLKEKITDVSRLVNVPADFLA